jgi:hypothetical protein
MVTRATPHGRLIELCLGRYPSVLIISYMLMIARRANVLAQHGQETK